MFFLLIKWELVIFFHIKKLGDYHIFDKVGDDYILITWEIIIFFMNREIIIFFDKVGGDHIHNKVTTSPYSRVCNIILV